MPAEVDVETLHETGPDHRAFVSRRSRRDKGDRAGDRLSQLGRTPPPARRVGRAVWGATVVASNVVTTAVVRCVSAPLGPYQGGWTT